MFIGSIRNPMQKFGDGPFFFYFGPFCQLGYQTVESRSTRLKRERKGMINDTIIGRQHGHSMGLWSVVVYGKALWSVRGSVSKCQNRFRLYGQGFYSLMEPVYWA